MPHVYEIICDDFDKVFHLKKHKKNFGQQFNFAVVFEISKQHGANLIFASFYGNLSMLYNW